MNQTASTWGRSESACFRIAQPTAREAQMIWFKKIDQTKNIQPSAVNKWGFSWLINRQMKGKQKRDNYYPLLTIGTHHLPLVTKFCWFRSEMYTHWSERRATVNLLDHPFFKHLYQMNMTFRDHSINY